MSSTSNTSRGNSPGKTAAVSEKAVRRQKALIKNKTIYSINVFFLKKYLPKSCVDECVSDSWKSVYLIIYGNAKREEKIFAS